MIKIGHKAIDEVKKAEPPLKRSVAGEAFHAAVEASREPPKRGRPVSANAKQQITLRLDPDVIQGFRAMGDGWQAYINAALRKSLKLK